MENSDSSWDGWLSLCSHTHVNHLTFKQMSTCSLLLSLCAASLITLQTPLLCLPAQHFYISSVLSSPWIHLKGLILGSCCCCFFLWNKFVSVTLCFLFSKKYACRWVIEFCPYTTCTYKNMFVFLKCNLRLRSRLTTAGLYMCFENRIFTSSTPRNLSLQACFTLFRRGCFFFFGRVCLFHFISFHYCIKYLAVDIDVIEQHKYLFYSLAESHRKGRPHSKTCMMY